ncbi:MAG: right-handed parallel beta-helix repeat-containing protein [bacterium]|nr:right-handed parallel beta-helix repeat-containing protein [bacterium]
MRDATTARVRGGMLGAVLVLGLAHAAHAAEYWVKNGGSDAANGLSPGTAWATLVHAAAAVGPGDTVRVLDGAYRGFYLDTSGTPGNPITFRAEGPNVRIVQDNPRTPDGINLEGASWVVIDGFVVNDRSRTGIRAVEASHVTIRNNSLGSNYKWGILTGHVDDVLIEHNEAYGAADEHGIYVSNACDRPVVRYNVVHHNVGNGLHFNGDASFGGDGIVENALVEGNVIYENGFPKGGSGINMDGGVNGVIRNNLLYANHASGISLYRIDAAAPSTGNLVVNNTIIQASDARWAINIRDGSTGNTVRNNILWNAHAFRGVIAIDAASRPGFTSDYNSVMSRLSLDGGGSVVSLAAWQAQGYDAHSFVATPADHFLVPGSDWHLRPTSPAVDAGTLAGAPATDLDGAPRPVGAGVDLGAYELQLLTCGDGNVDPGEQCGEPTMGSCADPCTTCVGCTCAQLPPTCGDGLVCGSEACEQDADCGDGRVCSGCQCIDAALCTSGTPLVRPKLVLAASPMKLTLKADATIPQPFTGVNPPANGVRLVVDSTTGPGGLEVAVPAGPLWKTNGAGTVWTYADRHGTAGGITKLVVQNRSAKTPGLLRVTAKGKGGSVTLPHAASTRAALVLGSASECAAYVWNGPTSPRPRCNATSARTVCK